MIQEENDMKNELSRRDFLRLSGAVMAAVALGGALTGCGYDAKPVEVRPFTNELTAGNCKVTFLTVGGSKSFDIVQQVTLKVENLGSEAITLEKADFAVMANDSRKLELNSCTELVSGAATGQKDVLTIAAEKEMEISLWFEKDSQLAADTVNTVTASVTINGVTVSAIEQKENFKWWYG